MKRIHVLLHRPEGNLNIGSIARAMANFDVTELHLVDCPHWDREEARLMACHAQKILDQCHYHHTLESALSHVSYVVGFTARKGAERLHHYPLPRLSSMIPPNAPVGLLFGSESSGLPNEALSHCNDLCWIPTGITQPSLNLSHAVGTVLYDIFRVQGAPTEKQGPQRRHATAAQYQQIDQFIEELASLSGFRREGNISVSALRLLKRSLRRGCPSEEEALIALGFLSKLRKRL